MIKRLMWFTSGVAAGAGAVVLLGKRIRRRVASLTPVKVAERGLRRARDLGASVRDAVAEGAAAMRQREQELRGRLDGRERSEGRTSTEDRSKVIVLHDAQRTGSARASTRRR
ncbi:MAG: hypothetical protein ACKOA6_06030 [Actinomycetota bacterium]